MFCFRYTSGVCKHKKTTVSYSMGLSCKLLFISLPTMIDFFTDSFTVRPSKQFAIKIYDISHMYPTGCRPTGVKNFNNRSIFGEDMNESLRIILEGHPVC